MSEQQALRERAVEILRGNDRGGYTIPTAGLYPFQWNWDAGLTALGWARIDEPRAWREMSRLFEGLWDDGLLPHIVFHVPSESYFPGPEFWGAPHQRPPTSGISQPPVSATVVRLLLDSARDRDGAEANAAALYPQLLRHHRWWHRARDPGRTGLVVSYHPWETGRDNHPAWDAPLAAVPPTTTAYPRRDLQHVDGSQRPRQSDYDRYIYLVELFRSLDYAPDKLHARSPFQVLDVGINAILARADRDLRALAGRFGTAAEQAEIDAWTQGAQAAFERLWDGTIYQSHDLRAERRLAVPGSAGFLPLYAGLCDRERATALARLARRWGEQLRYRVPSTAPDHPDFEPRRYWRGPVWAIVNWMVADGFARCGEQATAECIKADTAALLANTGFYEYFDPQSGAGYGGGAFSWTAAMGLHWALN